MSGARPRRIGSVGFLFGQRVPLLDRVRDPRRAVLPAAALDPLRLFRERVVLDRRPEPPRVIALAEMMEPGLLVHALRHLQEDGEVLGPQLQPALGTAEDEGVVLQISGRVLAAVAAMLRLAGDEPQRLRRAAGPSPRPPPPPGGPP